MFRPRKQNEKNAISIEKNRSQIQPVPYAFGNTSNASSSTFIQPFYFKIGGIIDPTDPAKAWDYNIPMITLNQKSVYLKTQSFQVSILGFVGTDFPQQISIGLRGYSGLQGRQGVPTNRIIVLGLTNISSAVNEGILSRDLTYRNQFENLWSLGSLRHLQLEIYLDEETTPIILPSDNQIAIMFKIVHVSG